MYSCLTHSLPLSPLPAGCRELAPVAGCRVELLPPRYHTHVSPAAAICVLAGPAASRGGGAGDDDVVPLLVTADIAALLPADSRGEQAYCSFSVERNGLQVRRALARCFHLPSRSETHRLRIGAA